MMFADFEASGYMVVPDVLLEPYRSKLLVEFAGEVSSTGNRGLYAQRNLLRDSQNVRDLASSPAVMDLARQILGMAARGVKATFFDKQPEANWKVPPHQDVTIAVKERVDVPEFGPWTVKEGVHNVQPPADILERMVAFRFHLDPCPVENGALKVWPGSHLHGRLYDAALDEWVTDHAPVTCPVDAFGLLVMRPLLLHASSPAERPSHRRVIHIEYAGCDLPGGLNWLDEVA